MNEIELVLLLLVAVTALTPLARKLRVPYPILLVVAGLILALMPFVPDIQITPELGSDNAIQTIPTNLLAGLFGFASKPYFEVEEPAREAPQVRF